MSTAKVDSKKRIVLPNGRPGDVYDIQQQADGSLRLVRLEWPQPRQGMTREQIREAMRRAPLTPIMSWEELRDLTREP